MCGDWRTIGGAVLATVAAVGVASADVIGPGGGVVLGAVPETAKTGPVLSGPLAPSEAMLGADWRSAFGQTPRLLGLTDPLPAAVRAEESPMTDLARPQLPPGPLLGAGSERITPWRSWRNPELGSIAEAGHNKRIPEPGSITLVVAGIIGLVARVHLRRKLQGCKGEAVPDLA